MFPPSPGIPVQLLQTTSVPSLHLHQHQADIRQSFGIAHPLPWLPVDEQGQRLLVKHLEKKKYFLGIHAVVGHSRFPTIPFAAGGLQLPEASQPFPCSLSPRYDTPASSKKKVRPKDRNKLSTEERRKLFEQEVAQREAQKQQQQLQNLGMTSPLPYDSMGYGTPHHSFMGYPPGYPMQAYVDPSNPNAGKVLLPTPSMDSMCSPAGYEHSQTLVGHSVEPALSTPQPVPVVQHVAPAMEVTTPQFVAQGDTVVHQEANVAVLPVAAAGAAGTVQSQSYGVWDSSQQPVAVQQPYSPAQSQPAIYYQGQTCQTVYGVTSPYSQTTPPIVQVIPAGNACGTRAASWELSHSLFTSSLVGASS